MIPQESSKIDRFAGPLSACFEVCSRALRQRPARRRALTPLALRESPARSGKPEPYKFLRPANLLVDKHSRPLGRRPLVGRNSRRRAWHRCETLNSRVNGNIQNVHRIGSYVSEARDVRARLRRLRVVAAVLRQGGGRCRRGRRVLQRGTSALFYFGRSRPDCRTRRRRVRRRMEAYGQRVLGMGHRQRAGGHRSGLPLLRHRPVSRQRQPYRPQQPLLHRGSGRMRIREDRVSVGRQRRHIVSGVDIRG